MKRADFYPPFFVGYENMRNFPSNNKFNDNGKINSNQCRHLYSLW